MKKILSIAALAAAMSLEAGVSPVPKIQMDATCACVMDIQHSLANPVYRGYYDYIMGVYKRNASMKAIFDVCEACGLGADDGKWAAFTVGKIVRPPDDAATFNLPDISCTLVSKKPVTIAPLEAAVKSFIPAQLMAEIQKDLVITDVVLAGEKATVIASKEPMPTDLKFCYGVVQGKALVVALTEGAFERQARLVKSPKVPSDPRYASLLKPSPATVTEFLAPAVGKVVSSLAKPEELAMLGEMPSGTPVADTLTGLGDIRFSMKAENDALAYVLSVEFGTEADAAFIVSMAQMGIASIKGEIAAEPDSAPEVVLAKKLFGSFKAEAAGKTAVFSAQIPVEDLKSVINDQYVAEIVEAVQAVKAMIDTDSDLEGLDDDEDEDEDDDDEDDDDEE